MFKNQRAAATCCALLAALAASGARADGHYTAGVEGIQAGSAPPPGVYYVGYLVDYDGRSVRAPTSGSNLPGSNTIKVAALANRAVWMTGTKFLGADYGVEAVVPLVRTRVDLQAVPVRDTRSGIGDVYLGPVVLAWHDARWDAVFTAGEWLDSASHDRPASAGKGFATTMFTAGGTLYLDAAKSTTASVLTRYELNGHADSGFKPGSQLTLEWGLGRGVGPVVIGVVGYGQWQLSHDSGPGATDAKASRSAFGAEVVYPVPGAGLFLKGAFYDEFHVAAGTGAAPKGNEFRATIVKAF